MRIDILTLFPAMFRGPFDESIVRRARERGLLDLHIHNIRDFTHDRHHVVDDYPYGGGPGMVMMAPPIFEAVESVRTPESWTILTTPRGRVFRQAIARELAQRPHLIIICGHYEGVDERVHQHLVDDEISIGDFILTGGELPAMVIVDAVTRLLPGVIAAGSAQEESYSAGLLEHPQYTRPARYRGWEVPAILLSGHHQQVAAWRRREALRLTLERRPDLLTPELWAEARRLGLVKPEGERADTSPGGAPPH